MGKRLDNVQALRGVACLLVVLFHLQHWDVAYGANTPVVGWFGGFGFAGVDLFFVLSGFIITHTNRHHLGRPAAVPGYLFRRLWRIFPTYWAALAGCVAATVLVAGWPHEWKVPAGRWAQIVALDPRGSFPNAVIGQAWTLTYELLFYVVFGVLMLVPPRLAAAGLAAWAAAAAAALLGPPPDMLVWSPLSPFVLEFLAGCLIAWATARGVTGGRWAAAALAVAWAAVGSAAVGWAWPDWSHGAVMSHPRPRVLVFGVPAALLVYAAVAAEERSAWRPGRWLRVLGDASYSLYLTHAHVMIVAVLVGTRVPHTRWPHVGWLAVTFAACLAVGLAFHYAVERPLLNLARRERAAPAPVEAPARVAA